MAIDWFNEVESASSRCEPGDPAPVGGDIQFAAADPFAPCCADTAADRLHAIVMSLESDLAANFNTYSTIERQHIMTAIAQAKQAEVLVSSRVRKPEGPLDHRHNSLIANTAQAVIGNSIKADEASFKRQRASKIPEMLAQWHAATAEQAAKFPDETTSIETKSET